MSIYSKSAGSVEGYEPDGKDVPNNAISLLEARDSCADLVNLAGDVASDDSGPLLNEDACVRHVPIEGINGDCGVFDDELACTGSGHWGIGYFKGSAFLL